MCRPAMWASHKILRLTPSEIIVGSEDTRVEDSIKNFHRIARVPRAYIYCA